MGYKSDENAREKQNVNMITAALHPDVVKRFNHIIEAQFEHHLLYKAFKTTEFNVFPD